MRVLGTEATADPTAIEQEVRRQMEERQQVRTSGSNPLLWSLSLLIVAVLVRCHHVDCSLCVDENSCCEINHSAMIMPAPVMVILNLYVHAMLIGLCLFIGKSHMHALSFTGA